MIYLLLGYTLVNLENFRNLRHLILDVDIEVSYLIEIIKSNPNLMELEFISPGRNGKVADVAKYCQNLDGLSLEMNPSVDAGDYIPFAKLPHLRNLDIRGNPMEGSYGKLFKSLAESRSLQVVVLRKMVLNAEEIGELSNIRSLKRIHFRLQSTNTAQNIEFDLPIMVFNTTSILDVEWDQKKSAKTISNFINDKSDENNLEKNVFINNQERTELKPYYIYIDDLNILIRDIEMRDFISGALSHGNILDNMEELCNTLNIPTDINKICSYFVLKSFVPLLKEYAENINLLAKLNNLEWLEIEIKVNIRNELKELQETNQLFHVLDIEKSIPLDPTSIGLILMYQIHGLNKILSSCNLTAVNNDHIITNCEISFFLRFSFHINIPNKVAPPIPEESPRCSF